VDVKVGIQQTGRELVVDADLSQADVEKAVTEALSADTGVLTLVDRRGRKIIVPVAKLAYVEIDESDVRRVGFTAGD